MSDAFLAELPEPPYFAVIFCSRRTHHDADADAYAEASAHMLDLAARQPGFLGVDSVRDARGCGITVSYWDSEAAIAAWKRHAEHAATRAAGRTRWYEAYELRVARVERAYGWRRAGAA